jgi:3-dehydroquinate synthase
VKRIAAEADGQAYDIVIGGSIGQLPQHMARVAPSGTRVGVVADASIAASYGRTLRRGLNRAGFYTRLLVVPSGEGSKTLRQAERLLRSCARAGLDRQSWLVALGGGVIGDLAGFVAATYLRGVSLVQVPTTLLAQVDASIGGKTGVDIPEGKNLVGCFYQPWLVWIDPTVLRTLPKAHWRNGLAEVIKYGAVQDSALFGDLEKGGAALFRGFSARWTRIIACCAAIKARIVEKDPLETQGLRALLNFGHSVGHALEAATGYRRYLHGEAVSIGMYAAAWVSEQMGLLKPVERIRLGTLLSRAGLPIRAPVPVRRSRLMEFLERDKKVKEASVRFVLLERLGRATSGHRVSPVILDRALSACGL